MGWVVSRNLSRGLRGRVRLELGPEFCGNFRIRIRREKRVSRRDFGAKPGFRSCSSTLGDKAGAELGRQGRKHSRPEMCPWVM